MKSRSSPSSKDSTKASRIRMPTDVADPTSEIMKKASSLVNAMRCCLTFSAKTAASCRSSDDIS